MGLFDIFRRKKEEAKQEDALVEVQQQEELSQGLEKTKQGFFSKLARAVAGRDKVDDVVLDQLEEAKKSRDDLLQNGLVGSPCSPKDSRVFSNTAAQKHQFFGAQLSL